MRRMLLITIAALLPLLSHAQTPVQDLSSCLADNTTGKDRKGLAKWVFLAMAAHPDIKGYAAPSAAAATDESNKATAALFTRLLAENCAKETQAAMASGGAAAIQGAFSTLGALAMQELMSDKDVKASMGAFEKYIDQKKLAGAMAAK